VSLVTKQTGTIHLSQPITICHHNEFWSKETRVQRGMIVQGLKTKKEIPTCTIVNGDVCVLSGRQLHFADCRSATLPTLKSWILHWRNHVETAQIAEIAVTELVPTTTTTHLQHRHTMSETSLLDLPDELVIRCLAGAGGMGIGSASAACTRLQGLAHRLRQLPVFSSALSTRPSLQHAITDAGQRALSASFGGCYCNQGLLDKHLRAFLFVATASLA
jgi:hypothetical protein